VFTVESEGNSFPAVLIKCSVTCGNGGLLPKLQLMQHVSSHSILIAATLAPQTRIICLACLILGEDHKSTFCRTEDVGAPKEVPVIKQDGTLDNADATDLMPWKVRNISL